MRTQIREKLGGGHMNLPQNIRNISCRRLVSIELETKNSVLNALVSGVVRTQIS